MYYNSIINVIHLKIKKRNRVKKKGGASIFCDMFAKGERMEQFNMIEA